MLAHCRASPSQACTALGATMQKIVGCLSFREGSAFLDRKAKGRFASRRGPLPYAYVSAIFSSLLTATTCNALFSALLMLSSVRLAPMKCLHGGSEIEAVRVFRACIYSCFVRALNSDRLWALARKANSLLLLVLPVGLCYLLGRQVPSSSDGRGGQGDLAALRRGRRGHLPTVHAGSDCARA